ncbi:MAG: hypothetical protein HY602_02625 [Parcubacteria group bacterium]|nr:hypothetical protein [Parcubacteria group bacterium]
MLITKETMIGLQKTIGARVSISYFDSGKIRTSPGLLSGVQPYVAVRLGSKGDPLSIHKSVGRHFIFIGFNCAIQKIVDKKGKTLYHNPLISNHCKLDDQERVIDLIEKTFGGEVALLREALML